MQVFLWILLILLLIAGVIAALRIGQQRRERERLWNSLDGEPSLPAWNEESLGVSAVRVHETQEGGRENAAPPPRPAPLAEPPRRSASAPVPAPAAEEDDRSQEPLSPRTSDDAPADPPADADAPAPPPLDPAVTENAPRPMRRRPEWWEDDAPGTGALLRSLVEATGGSAALVRPDPADDGYLILAAAGPASAALHAHSSMRRFVAGVLTDLPREPVTVVLGPEESGVLPGMEPGAVGETAVRALAPAPAPRRLLLVDVPVDRPLDGRAERLLDRYADLLADVMGLPLTPPPPPEPERPADPIEAAMATVEYEMTTARETGREVALALVVPFDQETLLEADPEAVDQHEAALRERLLAVNGTRSVEPMGALVYGAICDAEAGRAETWARAVAVGAPKLRIGMAIYGPRHVTPALLRQDAAHALRQTYAGEDTCVIVE